MMERFDDGGWLEIRATADGGLRRLALVGELDLSTSGQLQATVKDVLAETGVQRVVLDLTELQFCDSVGMTALITSLQQAQAAGIVLTADHATGMVGEVLATTGLDKVLLTDAADA